MSIKSLLVAILFIVSTIGVRAQRNSTCRTLNGEMGSCIAILTCPAITQLLQKSPQPLPPDVIQTVKRSHCGTFDNVHYVCCKMNQSALESRGNTVRIHASTPKSELDVQMGMLALEAFKCGQISEEDRLIIGNGWTAKLSEYPWMALLVYDDGLQRTMECGGSLISDQYVITAAHCIRVGNRNLVAVRLGEHDLNQAIDCEFGGLICAPPVQEIDIAEAVYHKDFSASQFSNDIGLIRLNAKVVFSSSIQPICLPNLPQSQMALADSRRLIIAGWGRIVNGMRANLLQTAEVPVRDNAHCQQIHRLIRITDQQICAGSENNVDTCTGDSGGPIFAYEPDEHRYVQYGIVSAGASNCGSKFPGIYVNISAYLPWIAGNIRL